MKHLHCLRYNFTMHFSARYTRLASITCSRPSNQLYSALVVSRPAPFNHFRTMATQTRKALVIRERDGKQTLVQEQLAMPQPASNQALVKVSMAAQNPTDVLCFDGHVFGDGSVLGCDFAGVVEAIGSEVTRLKTGDKVAGLIWGGS